jgi:hypothetical protein
MRVLEVDRMRRWLLALALVAAGWDSRIEAQTAISDLANWVKSGLPAVAEWNVNGFNPTWHVNQVRAGHRLIPSVFLPLTDVPGTEWANDPNIVKARLTNFAADFAYVDAQHLPLCLRTNNICQSLGKSQRYRAPLVAASIPPSPLCWRIYNGALDDTPLLDSLGPVVNWKTEGTFWGQSAYLQKLQTLVKSPACLVFVENNEWPYEAGPYYTTTKNATSGATTHAYCTPDEIAAHSVRMRDHIQKLAAANVPPKSLDTEIALHRKAHYAALYAAFNAALTEGWKDKTYTAAYDADINRNRPNSAHDVRQVGYAPQAICYNAHSPPIYITGGTLANFTAIDHANILNEIPAWEWLRAKDRKAYREVSLTLSGAAALAGATAGKHEVITPARYEGWIQWLLWSIHEPGIPVILRHWCSSATRPTSPFFTLAQGKTLTNLGAGAVKNLRVEDYVQPILTSVDRICANATLRDYWQRGQPILAEGPSPTDLALKKLGLPAYPLEGTPDRSWRVLSCNVNQTSAQWTWNATSGTMAGTNKVWAVATHIGERGLLYAWSPCKLTGKVTVTVPTFGTVTIAAPQPWGYWKLTKGGPANPLVIK